MSTYFDKTDAIEAKLDKDTFEAVINGDAGIPIVSRLGQPLKSLATLQEEFQQAATAGLGYQYRFSPATGGDPPTAGKMWFNHATPASVTAIAISSVSADSGAPDISDFIATWGDGTNAIRGTLTIFKSGTPAFRMFNITDVVADGGAALALAVSYVDHAGTFDADDVLMVQYARAGNQGIQGPMGRTLHTSVGVPSNLLGDDGEYCIDKLNWNIYGPKAGGAWGAATSIVGPSSARTMLIAPRTFFVRKLLGSAAITNASPGVATVAAHGLVANDAIVFSNIADPGTCTVTIASPGVWTRAAHGYTAGQPVKVTTDGALPTGITATVTCYVIATGLTTNNFQLSATPGGAAINTSVSQSGVHTVTRESAAPGGVTLGTIYYAKTIIDPNNLTVSATPGGAAINTTTAQAGALFAATGNDSGSGLANTASDSLLTIAAAVSNAQALDTNGKLVTVQLADGTYNAGALINGRLLGQSAASLFVIQGNNAKNLNVDVFVNGGNNCFFTTNGAQATIKDMRVRGAALSLACNMPGSMLQHANIDFGATSVGGVQQWVSRAGTLEPIAPYSISGGAGNHLQSSHQGDFRAAASAVPTVRINGYLTFTAGFAYGSSGADITWTGYVASPFALGPFGVTATRHILELNAICQQLVGPNFFPGNVVGTTASGAQYI